jgi:hypothetical protein
MEFLTTITAGPWGGSGGRDPTAHQRPEDEI